MANKLIYLGLMWVAIIIAYLALAFMFPAFVEIVSTANTSIAASANMSNFPGTLPVVNSAPLWIWAVPGLVGIVGTVIVLKKG